MTLYSPGGLNLADTTAPLILAYDDSGAKDVVFAVSNTGDLTITPDGGDVFIVGALAVTGAVAPAALLDISGASAGQLKFPASQNASANANTLDDYEEGTFTPTLFDAAGGGNEATYTTREGKYTKIGNVVYFDLIMNVAGIGGMTGGNSAYIRGLPFANRTPTSNFQMPQVVIANNITFTGYLTAFINGDATWLNLVGSQSGGALVTLTVTAFGTGNVQISGKYFIS